MALAGTNTHFREKWRKHFLSKITHRTNLRKGFFHENGYFWHFWAKNCKNGPCTKVIFFHFCQLFLTKSKSVKNEIFSSPQMIRVCEKKFPLFKIKNGFLAIFVILAKTRKWPKINFFFWKVEFFFCTQNSVGETYVFQFLHFWFGQKKWAKMEKNHFCAQAIFSAFSLFCLLFLTESKSV